MIKWVSPRQGHKSSDVAELVVTKQKCGEYYGLSFGFKAETVAQKFSGMKQLIVGFDEDRGEICFKPVENGGYTLCVATDSSRIRVKISENLIPRGINIDNVCDIYDVIRFDAKGEYYYIAIKDENGWSQVRSNYDEGKVKK